MVGFRLVCISTCEMGECPVGNVALAEVAGKHCGTCRAGMAFGEQSAADPAVVHERVERLVQQLGRELQKVVSSPDQKERLAQVGANAEWVSSADFTKFLQTEVANGKVMVSESGAKAE